MGSNNFYEEQKAHAKFKINGFNQISEKRR